MKTMQRIASLCLLALVGLGVRTNAQAQQRYDVGIFSDPSGTSSAIAVTPFAEFEIYVVAFDLDGLVKGFEVSASIPADVTVTQALPAGPAPINLGSDPEEFIVGTGGCIVAQPSVALVQLRCASLSADLVDAIVCPGPTTPSSFAGRPGYVKCDSVLVPFAPASNTLPGYPGGCLAINPQGEPPVAGGAESFGALKARY
jgi:hypothetical protein